LGSQSVDTDRKWGKELEKLPGLVFIRVIVVSSRRPENIEENDDEEENSRGSALDKNTLCILQDTGEKQTPRTTGDFQEPN